MSRVLVAENLSLLGAAIQSLLAGRSGVEVVGTAPRGYAELFQAIRSSRPDVVILEGGAIDPLVAFNMVMCLRNYPRLRLIVVNAADNVVYTYDKHQIAVTQAADLVGLIRSSVDLSGISQ